MEFKKVVLLGGGVLGAQIALMSAYTEHDTTIWMRSEGSIERTKPKLERYSKLMLKSLEDSKALIGNPIGAHRYPRALIKDWDNTTEEKIDELIAKGKKNMDEKLHLELDLAKALEGADIVIETMSEDKQAKIDVYTKIKDMMDEKTILVTNTSNMLPSTFAEYTGRPEKYMALHFANEIWAQNTAECMGHEGTSQETYDAVVRFAEEIHMIPIKLYKEQAHYVLNSMLNPFLASALELWGKDVADPETIDKTWRLATGAPAGPFQIIDVVGLNTVYNSVALAPASKDPNTVLYQVAKKLKEKIDKGEIGINAGKGFYTYEDNNNALL